MQCHRTAYASKEVTRLFTKHARKDGKPRIGTKEPFFCQECRVYHLRTVKTTAEPKSATSLPWTTKDAPQVATGSP